MIHVFDEGFYPLCNCCYDNWNLVFFSISIAAIVNEINSFNWQDGGLPWLAPSHKVTRPFRHVVLQDHVKTRIIISSLPQWLWLPNLTEWWLILMDFHTLSYSTSRSRFLARSRDKLKSYLHYHSAYGHQTLQVGDLPWGASI